MRYFLALPSARTSTIGNIPQQHQNTAILSPACRTWTTDWFCWIGYSRSLSGPSPSTSSLMWSALSANRASAEMTILCAGYSVLPWWPRWPCDMRCTVEITASWYWLSLCWFRWLFFGRLEESNGLRQASSKISTSRPDGDRCCFALSFPFEAGTGQNVPRYSGPCSTVGYQAESYRNGEYEQGGSRAVNKMTLNSSILVSPAFEHQLCRRRGL